MAEPDLHVLFLCSRNRLRSPTAEQVFASWPGIEVSSAGLARDADHPVTPELLEWADLVFVMEKAHRTKLSARFRSSLGRVRVVCLDIPDDYGFMEPALVELFLARVPRFFPVRPTIPGDDALLAVILARGDDAMRELHDTLPARLRERVPDASPLELGELGRELALVALQLVEVDPYQRPDRYVFASSWLREEWVRDVVARLFAAHPGFRHGILERLERFHGGPAK